ncbi:hypothetical protein DFJ63DRAFT_182396 [Scheffersomyces coipomensis]|uniref:uncharacterized protein n=1 Tax=Scheffersomyces coipomensis TaxID=1788519 RepID=UPI00315D9B3F
MTKDESHTNKQTNSVPLSFKIALATGAVAGAAITVITHKEEVLMAAENIFQVGERLLQQGAQFCRVKLEEIKQANSHFADSYEDHEFSTRTRDDDDDDQVVEEEQTYGRSTGVSHLGSQSDYDELTTPSASSDEEDYDNWSRDDSIVQSLD